MAISGKTKKLLGIALTSSDAAKELITAIEAANEKLIDTFVAPLAAGVDIPTTNLAAFPVPVVITSVKFLAIGAFAGIDNANTSVWDIKQGATTIVSKTYNTANQPVASALNDFGAIVAPNVPANVPITYALTNGPTAATPSGRLLVRYREV